MRAAVYHGQKDVRVEDVEPGTVGRGQVRVDVEACGICGTDLHEYAAGPIFVPGEEPHPISKKMMPLTLGHEFSGVVSEVGDGVDSLSVGDPVAINPIIHCGECRQCAEGNYHICASINFVGLAADGGFAENVVVAEHQAVPLGDDVPIEHGALVEPLAVGLHAVRRSGLQAGDSVAVFGSGPIGLSVIQSIRAAGAGDIIVSEPRKARRELATQSGATELIDPSEVDAVEKIHELTGGGVDHAFEVAGIEATYKQSIQATRPRGTTTIVSIFEEEASAHPFGIVTGERTIQGILAYLGGPRSGEEYGMVIDMLADGTLDVDPLITARIGLDDIVDGGFKQLLDPDSDHVKILVNPNE